MHTVRIYLALCISLFCIACARHKPVLTEAELHLAFYEEALTLQAIYNSTPSTPSYRTLDIGTYSMPITRTLYSIPFTITPRVHTIAQSGEFIDDFEDSNSSFSDSFDDISLQNSLSVTDPLHKFNVAIYNFNKVMYEVVFSPFVKSYDLIVPKDVQFGFKNVLKNLLAPMRMLVNIFQGDFKTAGMEFSKFIVNSTAGLLGYVDITAQSTPSTYKEKYMDDTLRVWGVPQGPYIILPFLGPRTMRAVGGMVVEIFINPMDYILQIDVVLSVSDAMRVVNSSVFYLDLFYMLEKTSLDPYTAQRELYMQYQKGKEQK